MLLLRMEHLWGRQQKWEVTKNSPLIHGVCAICVATSGNGVIIGTSIPQRAISVVIQIELADHSGIIVFCVVVVGVPILTIAVSLTGATIPPTTAEVVGGFAFASA